MPIGLYAPSLAVSSNQEVVPVSRTREPLGLQHGTLRLVSYQEEWPQLYAQEVTTIRQATSPLGDLELHHIGSTAVPGLAAKPIMDIALVAPPEAEAQVAHVLVALGYIDRGERSGRLFIRIEGGDIRTHNLHLYAPGDDLLRDHIDFRDALCSDPALRDAYERLKVSLLEGARKDYADQKTDFVRTVLSSRP